MRESVKSLRLYFGVVGILSFLSTVFSQSLFVLYTVVEIALSIGYIYFALALPGYLTPKRSKYVKTFLVLSIATSLLYIGIDFLTSGYVDFVTLVIGVLITWYLYVNVRRLSNLPAPTPKSAQ